MIRRTFAALALVAGVAAVASPASAGSFTKTFTAADNRSQAVFTLNGTTLTIALTETVSITSKGDLLDALFFDIVNGAPPVTFASATANHLFTTSSASTANADVKGGWIMGSNVNNHEIGFSAVGGSGLFAANLFTKGGGGDDYGIAGAGTNLGLNTFKQAFPYVEDTVTFTITGFTGDDVNNVLFAYNSELDETSRGSCTKGCTPPPSIPEPSTIAVLGLGLLGLGFGTRRRAA